MEQYKSISEVVDSFDNKALFSLIYSAISTCRKTIVPTDRSDEYSICVMRNFSEDYLSHKDNGSIDLLLTMIGDETGTKDFELSLKKNPRGESSLYLGAAKLARNIAELSEKKIPRALLTRTEKKFSELKESHMNQRDEVLRDITKEYDGRMSALLAIESEMPEDVYLKKKKIIDEEFEEKRAKKLKKLQRAHFIKEANVLSHLLEDLLRKMG